MELLVQRNINDDYPEAELIERVSSNKMEWKKDSIDGQTIYACYTIFSQGLAQVADVVTIAGFIYMIVHDYKAKVKVNEKQIDMNQSKAEIAEVINKELDKEKNDTN